MTEETEVVEEATPAPESDDSTETEEGAQAEHEQREQPPVDAEEPAKKPNRLQKRFDELTRQRYQLEAENRRLQEQLQGVKPEETKAPSRDDFDNYEDYLDARADYLAEQKVKSYQENQKKEEAARKRQEQQDKLLSNWEASKDKAREKYTDFDDVLSNDDAPLTETMAYALMESEYGADIGYHLGKNPEEAQRIASLSPARQAAELGKLELQISTKPNKPKSSKAPEPIETVSGSSGGESKPSDNDDIDTWMKKENARLAALGGG